MTRRAVRNVTLVALAVLGVAVCQRGEKAAVAADPRPADPKVSFAKDIHPLLVEKCGNCHGTKRPKKGIDYVTSYETTMRTVKAEQPDDSRLYRSLVGKGAKPMPPKNPLPEAEIAKVKAWIAAGAKNN